MTSWDPVSKTNNNNKDTNKDTHVVYVNDEDVNVPGVPKMVSDLMLDKNRFMVRVFDFMGLGLAVTAATCFAIIHTPALHWLLAHSSLIFVLLIAELFMVHSMSAAAMMTNLSTTSATSMFVAYAVMNGITLAPLIHLYTEASVAAAFLTTAIVFVTMSAYGYATKKDLTSIGSLCLMALIGLIISMIVNMFLGSTFFDMLLSVFAVVIFTGLIAWDAQKVKQLGEKLGAAGGHEQFTSLALIGALELYLDFLNLFIHLLKLMGERND